MDSEFVKLAYIEQDEKKVAFIRNLESKYLDHEFEKGNHVIFMFKCKINEFLQYHKS